MKTVTGLGQTLQQAGSAAVTPDVFHLTMQPDTTAHLFEQCF